MFDKMKEDVREALTNSTPENDLRARLHADHTEVSKLIDELLATDDYEIAMREDLRDQIVIGLMAHARAEEEVVYDFLAQQATTQADTQHAFTEHEEIDRLMAVIKRLDGGDSNLDLVVQQLKETVQHHVHDEETKLLPKAERDIGQERLAALIPMFNTRKASLVAELEQEASTGGTFGSPSIDRSNPLEESDSRF
jgi:hemerythrin superfamily protein